VVSQDVDSAQLKDKVDETTHAPSVPVVAPPSPAVVNGAFGEDSELVSKLCADPASVHHLLERKRFANGEAAGLRAENEGLKASLLEREAKLSEVMQEASTLRDKVTFLSGDLQQHISRSALTIAGVQPEYIEDVLSLYPVPAMVEGESEVDFTARLSEGLQAYKSKYPQWFGNKVQVRPDGVAVRSDSSPFKLGNIQDSIARKLRAN
jgi:hypothetical protein